MPEVRTDRLIVGVIGGVLSFVWAYVHLQLWVSPEVPPPFRTFFLIDSVLAIIAGAILLLTFKLFALKVLYVLELVFWWTNYLLLGLTRVLPAPLVGKPLPVTTGPALTAFVLDVILIVVVTYVFLSIRR